MSRIVNGLFALLLLATGLAYAQSVTTQAPGLSATVIAFTRDLTAATGSVAYTGCGFRPRALIGTGNVAGSANYYSVVGFAGNDRVGGGSALYQGNLASFTSSNFIIVGDNLITANQAATVSSYDTDGFTLSWTKTGSPTGTGAFYIICLR